MQFWIKNSDFYSVFKSEQNPQVDLNSVVHKPDTLITKL